MNSMRIQQLIFGLLIFLMSPISAMNLLRPYDTLIRPAYSHNYPFQVSTILEGGVSGRGYNSDNVHVNPLNIWQCTQNSVAMLNGFPADSEIGKKRVAVDACDDGTRGHFCLDSDWDVRFAGSVNLRSFFGNAWSLSAYLPFYVMELKNVCWIDQTKDLTQEDQRVKELLTDDIFANVCELGDGLDLQDWRRSGVGDLTLLVEWFQDFPQPKPLLKNVRVHWRAGVGLPTGLRQDEDKILALPFGRDGAFSLPFGMGLDLTFAFYMRIGFNVDLLHTFGNTRCRRIQTAADQTDLLFLKKTQVHKDFGLRQYFSLYAQVHKLVKGASLLLGYEFTKQGEDQIALKGNCFSSTIANMAQHLREWTMHELIVRADYDFADLLGPDASANPRLSLYARLPFNGRRIAAESMIGVTFAIDF